MPLKKATNKAPNKPLKDKPGMPKTPAGVQGPTMVVKKRDGNRPVKIY